MNSLIRYFTVRDLLLEDRNPDLPHVALQANGTGHADASILFRDRHHWRNFCRRVDAAAGPDPDFDAPVRIRYLGLFMTVRRTTDWQTGLNSITSTSQQSVFVVEFGFKAARRVLGLRLQKFAAEGVR